MKDDELLTRLRARHAADLRTCFPGLSERDLMQILAAKPRHAVYILQQCFGCGRRTPRPPGTTSFSAMSMVHPAHTPARTLAWAQRAPLNHRRCTRCRPLHSAGQSQGVSYN